MKKLVYLLMLVLVLSVVGPVSAEKVTLKWTTCCSQVARHTLFTAIAEQYMAQNPNVQIEWMYPGSYTKNMQTYFAAGAAPDVMWIGGDIWLFADLLLPLDDIAQNDANIAGIAPALINSQRWMGKQIGLPYGANSGTMMFNKDHFDKAGLATPAEKWTFDDLYRMAKQLTIDTNGDGASDQYGVHLYDVQSWAFGIGGDFYTPDQRQVRIANPVTISFVQWAADIINGAGGVSLIPESKDAAIKGIASMRPISVSDVAALKLAPFAWDVQKMPSYIYGGQRYDHSTSGLEDWAIPASTKYPEEAKAFVRFLFSKEVMQQITASGIVVPTPRSFAGQYAATPAPPANLMAFIDAYAYSHQGAMSHPYGRALWSWWTTDASIWANMWTGTVAAKSVLPEVQIKLNMMLDEYWASRK